MNQTAIAFILTDDPMGALVTKTAGRFELPHAWETDSGRDTVDRAIGAIARIETRGEIARLSGTCIWNNIETPGVVLRLSGWTIHPLHGIHRAYIDRVLPNEQGDSIRFLRSLGKEGQAAASKAA
ncbi:MAG: hypothetical protein KGI79_02060 [Patescibacteria group bacterium]|nr:hypothetical protein [Patescibacteria group bacterium]MDE2116636.1 hypothetical protein [Patescibacteria group bacterium]